MNSRYQWSLILVLVASLSGTMSYGMQPVASRAASRYVQPTISRWYNSFWQPRVPQVAQPSYSQKPTWYGRLYERFRPAERLQVRGETYEMLRSKAQQGQKEVKKTVEKAELLERLGWAKAKAEAQLDRAQDKLRKTGPLLMQARRDVRVLKGEPSGSVERECNLFERGCNEIGSSIDFGLAKIQRDRNMKSLKDIDRLRREIIEW